MTQLSAPAILAPPSEAASPRAIRRPMQRPEYRVTPGMRVAYVICHALARFMWICTTHAVVIRPEIVRDRRRGGYILASTHLSHLEPFLLGQYMSRPVDWMTRVEFFKYRPIAWLLRMIGAFEVRRFGVPVSAIRTAIARARQGRVVGVCPEGGVVAGADSLCRGGKMKKGVCLVACRAGVPVVPCVMLGTHKLNRVDPWLPFKRVRLSLAFGEPVYPDSDVLDRREARDRMAEQLQRRFVDLYRELCANHSIDDRSTP